MLEISKSSYPTIPAPHEATEETFRVFVPFFSTVMLNDAENVCGRATLLFRFTIGVPLMVTGSEHSAPLTAYSSVAFVNCGGS